MLDLSILIPTHNRKKCLEKCLQSVKTIYNDLCNVIVCDNSSIDYDNIEKLITTEKYINLRKYEGDLLRVYKTLIDNCNTTYCLILEDDDQLINKNLHFKCYDYLKTDYNVVSFAGIDNKNRCYLKNCKTNDAIPVFWNGEFLFSMAYFNLNVLKCAFDKWLCDKDRAFLINSDEALALISIYQNKNKYIHINALGLKIGINDNNLSWNNLANIIYTTAFYIDDLAKVLNITSLEWKNAYKDIQLRELNTLSNNSYTYNDIYQSKFLTKLRLKTNLYINTDVSYTKIWKNILYSIKKFYRI